MDRDEREKSLEGFRSQRDNFPKTLDDWQRMFLRIYGNVYKIQRMEQVGFHLMEESGEVANEIRYRNEEGLRDGIADVFAWVIAIANKCDELIGGTEKAPCDVRYWSNGACSCSTHTVLFFRYQKIRKSAQLPFDLDAVSVPRICA